MWAPPTPPRRAPSPPPLPPYHLIQLHNDRLGQGGLWVRGRGEGGQNCDTQGPPPPPQITGGTNTKVMRIKRLIMAEIRRLLWRHRGMNWCKRWYIIWYWNMSVDKRFMDYSFSLSLCLLYIKMEDWRLFSALLSLYYISRRVFLLASNARRRWKMMDITSHSAFKMTEAAAETRSRRWSRRWSGAKLRCVMTLGQRKGAVQFQHLWLNNYINYLKLEKQWKFLGVR